MKLRRLWGASPRKQKRMPREYYLDWARAYRARCAAEGRCIDCPAPRGPGVRCETCAERARRNRRLWQKTKRQNGKDRA